ncbi:MAG: hypothetical protein M9894_15235 [Planctomycetes bacterium]|nr:hypothetical protein [Planctomycetota bacterium]
MTPRTSTTLRLAGLALALAAAPGCMGTRTGHPDQIGSRNVEEFSRFDRAEPVAWRRVLVGVPRPRVRGYVKSTKVAYKGERDEGLIHFVYDSDFRLVGRVSPQGETRRIDARGGERREGSFRIEDAVLLLLNAGRAEEVKLAPMPEPRRG